MIAALGIEPDVPGGTLVLNPAESMPWESLKVTGLRLGDGRLSLQWESGVLTVLEAGSVLCRVEAASMALPLVAAPLGLAYASLGRSGEGTALLGRAVCRCGGVRREETRRLRCPATARRPPGWPRRPGNCAP